MIDLWKFVEIFCESKMKGKHESDTNVLDSLDEYHKRRKIVDFHREVLKCPDNGKLNEIGKVLPTNFARDYQRIVIRLHPSQVIQVWNILLDQVSVENVFHLQFFSWFLNHVHISDESMPPALEKDEVALIDKTREFLVKCSLDELDFGEKLYSCLELVHSLGTIQLLRLAYGVSSKKKLSKSRLKSILDLYPLHDFLDSSTWENLVRSCFESKNTALPIIGLKLCLQKIDMLLTLQKVSDDIKKSRSFGKKIASIMRYLVSIVEENETLLPKILPYISLIPYEDLSRITDLFIQSYLNEGITVDHVFSSFKGMLNENVAFQSALCLSIFKETISKLPDCAFSQLIAQLIRINQESHQTLSDLFSLSESQEKCFQKISDDLKAQKSTDLEFHQLYELLNIFGLLPLGYLSPLIQVQVNLFLSALLFSLPSKRSCKKILTVVISHLISIMSGVRYVWLFKYFDIVGYIDHLLFRCQNIEILPEFYPKLVSLVIERAFKDYKMEIESLEKLHQVSVKQPVHPAVNLFLSTALLNEINACLNKKTKSQSNKKTSVQEMSDHSSKIFDSTLDQIDISPKPFNDLISKAVIACINHKTLNQSLTSSQRKKLKRIIEKSFNLSLIVLSPGNDQDFEPAIEFLINLCTQHQNLEKLLPENCIRTLATHLIVIFLGSRLDQQEERDHNQNEVPRKRKRVEPILLENEFFFSSKRKECLSRLSEAVLKLIPVDEFNQDITSLMELLGKDLSKEQFLDSLCILEGLFLNDWSTSWSSKSYDFEEKKKLMNASLFESIMSRLAFVMNKKCLSQSDLLRADLIGLLAKILRCGKVFINSTRLYACVQCLALVPLSDMLEIPENFSDNFSSVHNFINELLMNHEPLASSCLIFLKDIVYKLFQNLVQASDQTKFLSFPAKIRQDIIKTATDFNKMISLLTQTGKNFSNEAPHLINLYISSNHQITIHPLVKRHLILVVYRLLSVLKSCENWSETHETIHCRQNESGREILRDLFENYEKYYVFKGRF